MYKRILALSLMIIIGGIAVLGVLFIHPAITTWRAAIPTVLATPPSPTTVPVIYEVRLSQHKRSIWKYTGTPLTGWGEIGTPNAQTASVVATLKHVYQLQFNNHILVYSGKGTTWNTVGTIKPGGEIDLGSSGQLYKMDPTGAWEYVSGTQWTQLISAADTAPLGSLTPGPNGALYAIGLSAVWQYTGTPISGWKKIDTTTDSAGYTEALSLVATPNGKLYELRTKNDKGHLRKSVWEYTGIPLSWKEIGTQESASLLGDGKNQLYQVVKGGEIWRYSGSGSTWNDLKNPAPAQLHALTGSIGGLLFALLRTGAVWMLYDGTWTQIDTATTTVGIASSAGGRGTNAIG